MTTIDEIHHKKFVEHVFESTRGRKRVEKIERLIVFGAKNTQSFRSFWSGHVESCSDLRGHMSGWSPARTFVANSSSSERRWAQLCASDPRLETLRIEVQPADQTSPVPVPDPLFPACVFLKGF